MPDPKITKLQPLEGSINLWLLTTNNPTLIEYVNGTRETSLPSWGVISEHEEQNGWSYTYGQRFRSPDEARRCLDRTLPRMDDAPYRIKLTDGVYYVEEVQAEWVKPSFTDAELKESGWKEDSEAHPVAEHPDEEEEEDIGTLICTKGGGLVRVFDDGRRVIEIPDTK